MLREQKRMLKRVGKSDRGRKWVTRGSLLAALLVCLLLLIRCGEKPEPVLIGDRGAALSQPGLKTPDVPVPAPATVQPPPDKESAGPKTHSEPQRLKVDQSTRGGGTDIKQAPAQAKKPDNEDNHLKALAREPMKPPAGTNPSPLPKKEEDPKEWDTSVCPGAPTAEGEVAGAELPSGKTFTDPVTGISFVLVKGGCFEMGSDYGNRDEKPAHEVCVDDFYMGEYEVTQAQFGWVTGQNPSLFKGCDNPVESVSWEDVQSFIRKLNQASSWSYRLPTEAEWEYAARSGSAGEATSGAAPMSQEYAWYTKSTSNQVYEKRQSNGLGLYDMNFNVWEWVSDWYRADYYASSPRTNPKGPQSGTRRVIRAGSGSRNDPQFTRRYGAAPNETSDYFGFRVAFSKTLLTDKAPKLGTSEPADPTTQNEVPVSKRGSASNPDSTQPLL